MSKPFKNGKSYHTFLSPFGTKNAHLKFSVSYNDINQLYLSVQSCIDVTTGDKKEDKDISKLHNKRYIKGHKS